MKQKSVRGRGNKRELKNREMGRKEENREGKRMRLGETAQNQKGKGQGKQEEEARRGAKPEEAQHPPLPPAAEPGVPTPSPAGHGHRWAKLSCPSGKWGPPPLSSRRTQQTAARPARSGRRP